MAEFGTPNEILPAPDGERNVAYNAAVIQSLTNEVIGGAERERLGKILWARGLGNELGQRIANLRALHKRAGIEGYAAGLEAAAIVADQHRGSAAKARIAEGQPLGRIDDDGLVVEIRAEERGEDIAAEIIAKAIRALGKEEG